MAVAKSGSSYGSGEKVDELGFVLDVVVEEFGRKKVVSSGTS